MSHTVPYGRMKSLKHSGNVLGILQNFLTLQFPQRLSEPSEDFVGTIEIDKCAIPRSLRKFCPFLMCPYYYLHDPHVIRRFKPFRASYFA